MLTFDQVLNVRLGSLSSAVTDWSGTIKKLKELEEKAENGLQKRAEKADWAGKNAGITKPFVKKTAKEFRDAAKVAESIRNVLRDALSEFKTAKEELENLVKSAPARGIRIDSDGTVSYQIHPDRRSKDYDGPEPTEKDFNEARATIKAAVDKANDADEIASRALQTLIGKDKNNFSGTDYNSLTQAARTQDAEDAKRAAKIATKGDDASPEEIDRLNKYFKDNKGDDHFAEQFALAVGPRGNLEYWADMGDSMDGSRLAMDNLGKIKELQENWSMTLAHATQSDSKEMTAWKSEVIRSGDDVVRTRGSSAYGFQIMSNLMRHGEFDEKFLKAYGDAMTVTERKLTHDGSISPERAWASASYQPRLNWNGTDLGRDPMTGFMESLGHNPKASVDFFNSSIDLTPDDKSDNKKLNTFDYFTEKREWPADVIGDGDRSNKYGHASLGHALESATLGHAYDDPTPKLARDDDTAKVMEKVVEKYGSDPGLLKEQEVLSDSLGRMGAGYIDDINWSLNDNADSSIFAPGEREQGHAEFGRDGARQFLSALGQHPDAYSEVSTAERVYTISMMESHVGSNENIHEPQVREAVRTGAEVHGMLDQSRADQVEAEGLKKDEEYNKAQEKRAAWVQFGVGVGIAAGAAFLPPVAAVGVAGTLIPLAQDQGQALLGQLVGNTVGDWTETHQQDSGDDIQERRAEVFRAGEATAETPMKHFLQSHNINPDESNFAQTLETDFLAGYAKGADRENQQGYRPQTGD